MLGIKQIIKRVDKLKADRATLEQHWQDVADYCIPNKNDIVSKKTMGEKRNLHIFDNTAIHNASLLAGSLHGLLTNPDREWFELTTNDSELDDDDRVRKWSQKHAKKIHVVLNNSNFQTEVHEYYLDLVIFGTAVMTIEEDERDVVRFTTRPIKECMIAENHKGEVDEVYRVFEWEASKILGKWGRKVFDAELLRKFDKDPDKKWEIYHGVYPRKLLEDMGGKSTTKQEYVSQYILKNAELEIELLGFNEFPYVVSRWAKMSDGSYGVSPGMDGLPEAKTVNKMVEDMLMAAERVLDPPIQLPDDGFIMPIYTQPGGINYYRAGSDDRVETLFNEARIDFAPEIMEQSRGRIKEAFYVDRLQLREADRMTAQEVLQRTQEQSTFMGPILGRQRHEFAAPLISRVYKIMERRDLIEEVPSILAERRIDIRYSSMLARAQRIDEGQNILRTMEAIGPFVTMDPRVADNFDGDKATKRIALIFNFPQDIIRTQDEVEELRTARDEANAAMVEQQQQAHEAEVVSKVTPAAALVGENG